jgi:hypothetical protein
VSHCEENKTLLRYFDLNEIVEFAFYINENRLVEDAYLMSNYFSGIADITMNSLKLYYLDLLKHIDASKWEQIHSFTKRMQKKKFSAGAVASSTMKKSVSADSTGVSSGASSSSGLVRTQSVCLPSTTSVSAALASAPTASATASAGILITTSDAHTLTDGPTIFLTEDAKKIGNFYIQQSEIPKTVFQDIIKKIENNNKISSVLAEIEKKIEVLDKPDDEKKTKMKDKEDHQKSPELRELYKKAEELRGKLQYIALDAEYVPNMKPHQIKWTNTVSTNAFCPNIDEDSVKEIMALDVENYLKVLLLLGIGLFIQDVDARYLELMKKLANTQDLFMIIASSDFVFGTNYNFCHGFIGKDMANMTQAKTIQCLGRIGRSAIQSTYTVRFREDQFIYNLFKTPEINMEATNMARLFST